MRPRPAECIVAAVLALTAACSSGAAHSPTTTARTSRSTSTSIAAADLPAARSARLAVLVASPALKNLPAGARDLSTAPEAGADGAKSAGPAVTQRYLLSGNSSVLGPVADHYVQIFNQQGWGEREIRCELRRSVITVTAGQNASNADDSWPLRATVTATVGPEGIGVTVKLAAPHPSERQRFIRTTTKDIWSGCART